MTDTCGSTDAGAPPRRAWLPHGWGADDPAGFRHFALRAVLCYAAYLLAPEAVRGAAIAGAAAATYGYAIAAMRKPGSVR